MEAAKSSTTSEWGVGGLFSLVPERASAEACPAAKLSDHIGRISRGGPGSAASARTTAGRASAAPFAVGAYIGAAYFFTSSTSFANPAVTIGRTFTDTFAGIDPASVPAFVLCQLAGGALAVLLVRALHPDIESAADEVVVPCIEEP